MTGKQQTVGWLGLLLVIANLVDGALRPAFAVLHGGTHPSGGSSGPLGGWSPGQLVPGHGTGPGGLVPKLPLVPQGPVTGIPLSPIRYTPPTQTNPGAVPTVWA